VIFKECDHDYADKYERSSVHGILVITEKFINDYH